MDVRWVGIHPPKYQFLNDLGEGENFVWIAIGKI
jgi:hypothetical protein